MSRSRVRLVTKRPPVRLAKVLQQKSFNAMRVDLVFAGRPGKDGEPAILRSDQRHGIVLIMYKLRRGEMACATELSWLNDLGAGALNRLSDDHIDDLGRSATAYDLGAEG